MKTSFPFTLPIDKALPAARKDGLVYLDVQAKGKWEGILVVSSERKCIGIRCNRQTMDWHLPFEIKDIEDFRTASLFNRILAEIPHNLLWSSPFVCVLLMPLLIWSDRLVATAGPVAAILLGMFAQLFVLANRRMYCLPCGPLVLLALVLQVAALIVLF